MEFKTKPASLANQLSTQLALRDDLLPFVSLSDNELLYRTRDGDVVKVNVDTHHSTVVVPNQLFVSVVWLRVTVHPGVYRFSVTTALCSLPSRTDPGRPSIRCRPTCSTCCLPLK